VFSMSQAWGWKDPRNTFTLPFWLDIFPQAKIVHIVRHGVDVGLSLQKRERQQLQRSRERHARRKWLYWLRPKRNGFLDSPRCLSLREGVRLWETYVSRASRFVDANADRAHTLRYETFLEAPEASLQVLAAFCGLDPTSAAVDECVAHVDASRAFAYRRMADLSIPSDIAPLLDKHAYSL